MTGDLEALTDPVRGESRDVVGFEVVGAAPVS
jgi:hypothetical protein